jgi:hypothetical protein
VRPTSRPNSNFCRREVIWSVQLAEQVENYAILAGLTVNEFIVLTLKKAVYPGTDVATSSSKSERKAGRTRGQAGT